MKRVVCDRCGAVMVRALDFNVHKCVGKRDLAELPMDLLRRLAYKEIDEAEAWRLADLRKPT